VKIVRKDWNAVFSEPHVKFKHVGPRAQAGPHSFHAVFGGKTSRSTVSNY
jgi:hypothetical protein